ncbi:MAG TPA: hypothetical protein PKH08_00030 [Clostridia bacterium]|jgi:hypothetical protein|nr:hypothetical protein [Clostridia bacterium]HOK82156.1 hypothetical protein [Clostridia bacterium]HOL61166.1 hypothetical protein [Clostridia bacterium]HPO53860.1 hypothetical protein [Clostridia bacterium]
MTATVFCENPRLALAERVAAEYKNGVVGYVGRADEELFRLLAERGNTVSMGQPFGEHIRLVVGSGGYDAVLNARKAAAGRRLFLITDIIDRCCFTKIIRKRDTEIGYQVPEIIFYSYNHTRQTSASAYASLVASLAACLDAAGARRECSALFALAKRIVRLLEAPLNPIYCAGFVRDICGLLERIGGGLTSLISLYGAGAPPSADSVMFANYLILAAFIRFTKYDFNGIFIGKDRTFLRGALPGRGQERYRFSAAFMEGLKAAVGGDEALSGYVRRYLWESGKKRISAAHPDRVFRDILELEEVADDRGLLASLCRMGFIDYLITENNREWN